MRVVFFSLDDAAPTQTGVLSLVNGAPVFEGDETVRTMLDRPIFDHEAKVQVSLKDNPTRYMELLPMRYAGSYFWAQQEADEPLPL
ncbi:MAG: hypothetical protein HY040_07205 [Planctomycetes bacterium]|nr:hypothetical protein [Planctomycetota bacterium]